MHIVNTAEDNFESSKDHSGHSKVNLSCGQFTCL